jgi:hypothetical protein
MVLFSRKRNDKHEPLHGELVWSRDSYLISVQDLETSEVVTEAVFGSLGQLVRHLDKVTSGFEFDDEGGCEIAIYIRNQPDATPLKLLGLLRKYYAEHEGREIIWNSVKGDAH